MVQALQLFFHSFDLLPCRFALPAVQFQRRRAGHPALHAVDDGGGHLQIAQQFGGRSGGEFFPLLPLRFEKQRGILQKALPDRGRALAPSRIELAGLARIATMLGEDRRQALAVFQTLPRGRDQKLHRRLRRDLALAHLLLNRFRQQLHQRQPPRHPTHAAIEAPRQLFQAVAETPLQLLQQPAHFQRAFPLG